MGGMKGARLQVEENRQQTLAEVLGISWEELHLLDYEVTKVLSEDGLLSGYVIKFGMNANPEVLSKIAGVSETRSLNLSPWVFERSYEDEYLLGAIAENIDHRASFANEIESSIRLQRLETNDFATKELLLRQIFISIIGGLETFLSDLFISRTLSSEWYLQKFVESHPEFKKQKISISEIYNISQTIRQRAKTVMVGTIYHKLPIVREMYIQTFAIEFPDISNLQKYVLIRHDLVHRNGRTINGELVKINDKLINELRSDSTAFVDELIQCFKDNYAYFSDDIPF